MNLKSNHKNEERSTITCKRRITASINVFRQTATISLPSFSRLLFTHCLWLIQKEHSFFLPTHLRIQCRTINLLMFLPFYFAPHYCTIEQSSHKSPLLIAKTPQKGNQRMLHEEPDFASVGLRSIRVRPVFLN